jgi:hypothetical protein
MLGRRHEGATVRQAAGRCARLLEETVDEADGYVDLTAVTMASLAPTQSLPPSSTPSPRALLSQPG